MKHVQNLILAVLVMAGAAAAVAGLSTLADPSALAGRDGGSGVGANAPGKAEPIAGSDLSRVTLTADAAQRLGVQTATVRAQQAGGKQQLLIPYAAVLYDPAGVAWIYTNPEPLVYVRHRITVDAIQGDTATLSEGPPVGTTVVTVGVAELYGTEVGVGEE